MKRVEKLRAKQAHMGIVTAWKRSSTPNTPRSQLDLQRSWPCAPSRVVFDRDRSYLTNELAQGAIWSDHAKAQELARELARVEAQLSAADKLAEVSELIEHVRDGDDERYVLGLLEQASEALIERSQPCSCTLIEISAGAGGHDAQDWTSQLAHVYEAWADRHGIAHERVQQQDGPGGIRRVAISLDGDHTSMLAGENGLHRVCHLSKFGDSKRRQTSLARVQITPVDERSEITMDMQDVQITPYAASGPGGQHRNRKLTAIRAKHVPTGIEAHASSRSQLHNKQRALAVLEARVNEHYSQPVEQTHAQPGRAGRVRTWSLWPQQRIVDETSGYKTGQVASALKGDIDELLIAASSAISQS